MIGPGSSKKRTKYTPFVVVLALIFPSHHKPSSPFYQKWAQVGSTVVLYVAAKPFCARNAAVTGR